MNEITPRGALLLSLGLLFSIVPPLAATLLYFPIWSSRSSGAVLSGFTLLLILLAFVPLFNTVKSALKSPSAYAMWFIVFLLFFMLSRIADEMTVISFVGFLGNLIGSLFFKAARRKRTEEKDEAK